MPWINPICTFLTLVAIYLLYGFSSTEIAAQSRSMHKSQGFESTALRAVNWNILNDWINKDKAYTNPFDGLDLSWTRINGGGNVKQQIDSLIVTFDLQNLG